jgi:hypothetical protein
VVTAKVRFENGLGATSAVTCDLTAGAGGGASSDRSELDIASGLSLGASFLVVHEFAGAGTVDLSCNDNGGLIAVTAHDLKIAAIKIDDLTVSEHT